MTVRRKRGVLTLSLLLVVGAVVACSSAPSLTAVLHVLAGTVDVVVGDAAPVAAVEGRSLVTGDTVHTRSDGRASIEFSDGSLTRLDRSTSFTLTRLAGNAKVPEIEALQESGNSFHRVVALAESRSRFAVATPTAISGVAGTEFAVFVGFDGETSIVVLDATVDVEAGGVTTAVDQGLALEVASDGTPGNPFAITELLYLSDWLAFNRVTDGIEDPAPDLGSEALVEARPDDDLVDVWLYPPHREVVAEVLDSAGNLVGSGTAITSDEGSAGVRVDVDLIVGHRVVVAYLPTGRVRATVVVPLTFDLADSVEDRVTGTADPGAVVVVLIEEPDRVLLQLSITADASGSWSALTGGDLDLLATHIVSARIVDADGDSTLVFPREVR